MIALTVTACSPSAFFGGGGDDGIKNQRNYRKVNTACSQMDLSSARLDVPQTRKIVACIDSQGALGDLGVLITQMDDAELAPFVQSINESLIDQPRNLFELERLLTDLSARGELDDALGGLGDLLAQHRLIARSLAMFRKSFADAEGRIDPLLLKAVERLARELNPDTVGEALDALMIVADARALGSLWGRLGAGAGSSDLKSLSAGLVAYARGPSRMGRELVDFAIDGSLFEAADAFVPDTAEGIRGQAAGWAGFLNTSLRDSGRIAGQLGPLFSALEQPIPCMKGARELRYGPLDVIAEMVELPSSQARGFIERDKLMQLFAAAPLCALPAEVTASYPALMALAASSGVEAMADVMRAAYKVERSGRRPLIEYLVRTLEDPAFAQLLPALGELERRHAWDELVLVASAPQLRDRSKIQSALRVLVEPLPAADGQAIYDVLLRGLTRVDAEELAGLLGSVDFGSGGLATAVRGARRAFYVNDSHPVLRLVQESMARATTDSRIPETLLQLSRRERFEGAVRDLGLMAKDGRLRDLLQTTTALFSRYAGKSATTIASLAPGVEMPASRHRVRHDWVAADLHAPAAGHDFGACSQVDLSQRWDQAVGLGSQLGTVAACVRGDGGYSEIAGVLEMLASERTSGDPERTLHALVASAYNQFVFTAGEARLLADWALGAVVDGRVLRAMRGTAVWARQEILRPLAQIASSIGGDAEAQLGLRRLGIFGAQVLRKAEMPVILGHMDDLYHLHPAVPAKPATPAYDTTRILRWIGNKECTTLGTGPVADPKAARLAEIVDEYENAAVNDGAMIDGKLRRSWTTAEFREEMDPIFKKFADIKKNGPVVRSLLKFAARFNDPVQYPPGYLEQWLRKRANRRSLTAYLYPGENTPRVRMVNDLDRLAITLQNADILFGGTTNIGLAILAELANAWGDVPFEKRPLEIQKKYPLGKPQPKTLAEVVDFMITSTHQSIHQLGLPNFPTCQQTADPNDPEEVQKAELANPIVPPQDPPPAEGEDPILTGPPQPPGTEAGDTQIKLYNLYNTLSVLRDNLDPAKPVDPDSDLRVLRDMFFDLLYTGPKANQNENAGLKNNMSVAIRLVRVGIMRQIGRLMRDTPADDADIHSFFATLIEGASVPEIAPALEAVFGVDTSANANPGVIIDPEQKLIWGVLDEIFKLGKQEDIETAKQLGFGALVATDRIGKSKGTGRNEMLPPMFAALQPMVAKHGTALARHTDVLSDLLTWQNGADFLRAVSLDPQSPARKATFDLVFEALSDPQRGVDLLAQLTAADRSAPTALSDLRARIKALDHVAEYQALKLDEIGRQVLNLIELRAADKSPLPEAEAALSRKLVHTVAGLMEQGNMELAIELLQAAHRKPEEFYHLLEASGRLTDGGEIPRLLDLITQHMLKPGA